LNFIAPEVTTNHSTNVEGAMLKGVLTLTVGVVAWTMSFAGGYYVSPTGSDANSGSHDHPWKTISKANATLVAGDTAYIMAGTYTQQISPANAGSVSRPLVYKNYQSDVCSLYVTDAVVNLYDKSYVVVDGLRLQMAYWANSPVVVVEGGGHNAIANCFIYGASTHNNAAWGDWPAVKFSNTSYNRFVGNYVDRQDHGITDDILRGDGVCMFGESRYNIVEENIIVNVSHFGIAVPYGVSGESFNIVRNNFAFDCHVGIGNTDATYRCLYEGNASWAPGEVDTYRGGVSCEFSPHTSIIRYNAFYDDSTSAGSAQYNPGGNNEFVTNTATSTPVDNRIYHNVFMGSSGTSGERHSLFIQNDAPGEWDFGRNVFANNIIAYPNAGTDNYPIHWQDWGKSFATVNDTFRCNLLWNYAPGSPVARWGVGSFSTYALTLAQLKSRMPNVWDASNFEASPLWQDSVATQEHRDFTLSSNSPCLDRAVPLTVTVRGSTSSTAIHVSDASYFHYNWSGGAYDRGDSISVDGVRAELNRIDYENNILYATEPVTVGVNKGVYIVATYSTIHGYQIRMQGAAPDVGAVEYGVDRVGPRIPMTIQIPEAPVLAVLPGGSSALPLSTTIHWSIPAGAEWYQLQISMSPAFSSTVVDESEYTSTSYGISGLGYNTIYFLRVRAFNQSGMSAWSESLNFTTAADSGAPGKTEGTNLLPNGNFESELDGWYFYNNGQGSIAATASAHEGLKAAKITFEAPGDNMQAYRKEIRLEPATEYIIRFAAKSSSGHDMSVSFLQGISPYTFYGLRNAEVDLDTAWREYSFRFTTEGFATIVNDAVFRFWFVSYASAGDEYTIDDVALTKVNSSAVSDGLGELPQNFGLAQNYPNPFNPTTSIRYQISDIGYLKLVVYDMLGREVAMLVNEAKAHGTYTVAFDGSKLASGTYLYRLTAGGQVDTKKMVLLR
jgi:hypothetical protein